MQGQPAFGYSAIEAGLVRRRHGLELEQKQPVDLLDVDPAILDGSNALAISSSLRAAVSGLANGRSAANFIVA
jgi:hypothetical protein